MNKHSLSLLCSLSLLSVVACQTTVPTGLDREISSTKKASQPTYVYPPQLVALASEASKIDPAIRLGSSPPPAIVYKEPLDDDHGVPYFRYEGVETYGATDSRTNTIYITEKSPEYILRHEFLHYLLHTRRGVPIFDHPKSFRDLVVGWD